MNKNVESQMINMLDILKKKIKEWGWTIVPYTFVAYLVLNFFLSSFFNIYKTTTAKNWIQLPAEVQSVSYDINSYYSATFEKMLNEEEVIIRYSYQIENKFFYGDKIGFGYDKKSFDDSIDDALLSKFKKNKHIVIYVNPDNKNESVIAPGLNDSIIWDLIITLMWAPLILFFITPFNFKQNNRLLFRIYNVIVLIIWVFAIFIYPTENLKFNIQDNIKSIEEPKTP